MSCFKSVYYLNLLPKVVLQIVRVHLPTWFSTWDWISTKQKHLSGGDKQPCHSFPCIPYSFRSTQQGFFVSGLEHGLTEKAWFTWISKHLFKFFSFPVPIILEILCILYGKFTVSLSNRKEKKKKKKQNNNKQQTKQLPPPNPPKKSTNFLHIRLIQLHIKESMWGQQLNQILFKSGKTEFKKDTGGIQTSVQKWTSSIMKICLESLWSLSISRQI